MTKKDNKDLTRIEDLSEFLHDLSEDFSDLEEAGGADEPPGLPSDNDDFMDMATDPDIKIPQNFHDDDVIPDFNALENNPDDFQEESENESFVSNEHDQVESFTDSSVDSDPEESNQFVESSFEDSTFEADTFESNDFEAPEFENPEFESENFQNDDFSSDQDENQFEEQAEFADENDTSSEDDQQSEPLEDEFLTNDFGDEEETSQIQTIASAVQDQVEEKQDNDFFDEPIESTPSKTPLPSYEPTESFKAPENFKELQQFARNMSYGNMAKEGNPPFSVILKDIKYEEDLEDIVRLLREYKIITEDDESNARASLRRGSMLIPRLGEFAAISLCHKLRRFEISILMGLTEEVHPAREYESDDRGLTTKNNIFNNKKHHWEFEKENIKLQDIIIATTPYLDNHDILEYISVVTESTLVDLADFASQKELAKELEKEIEKSTVKNLDFFPSISSSELRTQLTLNDIYQSLIEKCRAHALNQKGNALIGINFAITPIISESSSFSQTRYQITCSGSVVWVKKR